MQQRDRQDEGAKKPVGHIDMGDPAPHERAEEDDRIGDPDKRDQDVDRPLELGVFLAARKAERQGERRQHDDELPAPEDDVGQDAKGEPRVAGPLHDIEAGGHQGAAAEGEDHGIRMQGAQASIRQERDPGKQIGPDQFGGDDDTHQHANNAPYDGHHREARHNLVVVDLRGWISKTLRHEWPLV